jgi:DNA-binding IclR family transcriptional regulator
MSGMISDLTMPKFYYRFTLRVGMSDTKSGRIVQSVRTATVLLNLLRECNGSTITELSDRSGLSPGAVHTQLETLKQADYVVKDGHQYLLGPEFLAFGEHVRNHSELYQASHEQVEQLADASGEAAHLIIEHDGRLLALYERFGSDAVGVDFHDRKRERPLDHLHCTAAGKVILARLPEERISQIIEDSDLPRITEHTITDCDRLSEELAEIRDRGFAMCDQEQIEGIRAVGTAIMGADGGVAGAIAISGPTTRLKGERFDEEFPNMLLQAANICEINLQSAEVIGE